MDIADPAVAYEQLKRETAKMLNLDIASSSLLENLQVDLVSLLRLQIDDLQGAVLDGKQVDLTRLSAALTMLRQLLPEKALVSSPPAADNPDHTAAFNRIAEQIDRQIEQLERQMAMDPNKARAEFEAKLAAANNKYQAAPKSGDAFSDPASGFARFGAVSPSAPVEQPLQAAGGGLPGASPPQSAPPRVKSEAELLEQMDRVNSEGPPPHYLQGPREAWRDHVNSEGIVAPWFNPHG